MNNIGVTLTVGLLMVSNTGLADGNLVGKWVEIEGSRHGAKAGISIHGGQDGDRYAANADLSFTLTVEQQDNRSFHARWCSQHKCEDVVGVIRGDGKTLLMSDENGVYTGTLMDNKLELCYTEASPTFRVAACREMAKE